MRTKRILLFATGCLALAAAAACTGRGDKGDSRCALDESRYQGGSTDETCMVILDEEGRGNVQVGGPNASVFVIPTNGMAFSATATTITFTWTSPIDTDGDTASIAPAARTRTIAERVRDAVTPIRNAWAHEAPVTGAVHMIRVKGVAHDGGDHLFFTTRLQIAITGQALEQMVEHGGTVPVEITSVYLTENRILNQATDGPFRPAADTTFTFAP